MQKKLLALILICALSTHHFYKLIAYFSFKANQQYISVALCSNRAKPELNCLGACFLDKELKEIEQSHEKSKSLSSQNTKKQEEPAFIQSFGLIQFPEIGFANNFIPFINRNGMNWNADLFRPPQMTSLI